MRKIVAIAVVLLGVSACGIIGGGNKSGNNAVLCDKAEAINASDPLGKLDAGGSATDLKAVFETVKPEIADMASHAPDKVATAVKTYTDGFNALIAALDAAGYDTTKADQSAVDAARASIEGATAEITTYWAGHCGASATTTTG